MYNVYEYTIASGVPMSSSVTFNSVKVSRMFNYTLQFIWNNGTLPIGQVYLEVSLDGQNWSKYVDTQLSVSGNSDNHVVDVREPTHAYMRPVYNRTSGDGLLKVVFCGKGW